MNRGARRQGAQGRTVQHFPDHPVRLLRASTAGLLACGSLVLPAFPVVSDQWHGWQGLAAHSCGGSHGFGPVRVVLTVFPINPSGFASGTVNAS